MIHLYLSLPSNDLEHRLVTAILELNPGVGLVQAASGVDEITRQLASAHASACDGMIAVISGSPEPRQVDEIRMADEAAIPVWLLSDRAQVDVVVDHPVRSFSASSFLGFREDLKEGRLARP
jgi:hypothetical protein